MIEAIIAATTTEMTPNGIFQAVAAILAPLLPS